MIHNDIDKLNELLETLHAKEIVIEIAISTSEIVKSKIKNTFHVNVVGTFGAREGVRWLSENNVDLVVTTIPLELKSIPVVQVNPYFSEDDQESIYRFFTKSLSKNYCPSSRLALLYHLKKRKLFQKNFLRVLI
ncbi:hypothetical protein NRIC_20040 [Enterococcus florum]|uniref:Uncharacterized protein n=1 Tax=Enterococcus florum TaxID=2480627 RepID=A0A4P5PLG3_9ENTE|nr:hypothetical protein [Enterococcus florum]GCF94113.1 hypothetical protein NRIC_20040 [Enterococcus florum]